MKNKILNVLIILILVVLPKIAIPVESQRDTILLQYSGQDESPNCFLSHQVLSKPKIGLALSGGGARGIFQIGVLQVLEENNIIVDFIVGVSMGAIVGGFYAAGYSPYQIEDIVKEINWDDIIVDKPPRTDLFIGQKEERDRSILQVRLKGLRPVIPQSITAGQKLSSILSDLTMRVAYPINPNFNRYKVRFQVLTCDLVSGEKILLNAGNLAEAMKASVSFPLLFSPVQKDSMLLVDGGLINNIPVDEVKAGGVDLVIAVDATSSLHEKDRLITPWIIADQVTTIMQREKKKQQREKADITILLQREDLKSDNFNNIDSVINLGRTETLKIIDRIKESIQQIRNNRFPIHKYQVHNLVIHGISDEKIRNDIKKRMTPMLADELSYYEIYNALEYIYEIGIFKELYGEIFDRTLFIYGQENPSFTKICFLGNTVFPDSSLAKLFSSAPDQPINYYKSKNDLKRVIDLYIENGYSLAQIREVKLKDGVLRIRIDEGKISKILIQGNNRTRDYVILREFPLKTGDIFNINKASAGINNIHSTDLFANVSFEIKGTADSNIVVIKLIEKTFSVFRVGLRYDLEQKGKSFAEIVDENILGSANKLSFMGLYGLRDQGFNIQVRADRIFRSFLTYQFDIFYKKSKFYSYLMGKRIGEYTNTNSGFSLSIGQQIRRLGMLSARIRFKSIDLTKIDGFGYPKGETELKSIALQSVVDTRDKYPFATKGKYYKFYYEISSGTSLKSEVSFFKIYSALETYITFKKRNTLHPKVLWGASDLTTPYTEQFQLGGLFSFYGLNENENIGRYLFLTSLEYRYFFPFKTIFDFYWTFRYDLGSTWKTAEDINPRDVIQGFGTALSISTFLGPIHIAYGWNDVGKRLAYLSAGFEF